MKLLKNMTVLVVLCGLNSLDVHAKTMGEGPVIGGYRAPAAVTTPAPAKSNATYKQLHDKIMGMNKNQVIDAKTGMLSQTFIDNTTREAKAAGINGSLFGELLHTGVFKFATFSGSEQAALDMLSGINVQIGQAVMRF